MEEKEILNLISQLEKRNIDRKIIAYITLQFSAGLRISDLLSVSYKNISPSLHITIEQGKGSNTIITQPIFLRDVWHEIRDKKLYPVSELNRFWFYKLYKKLGITKTNGTGRNNSVTHAPRKMLAQQLYTQEGNYEAARVALGHKDVRSTKYYTDEKFRKAVLQGGIGNNVSGELGPVVLQKNGVIRLTRQTTKRRKK